LYWMIVLVRFRVIVLLHQEKKVRVEKMYRFI